MCKKTKLVLLLAALVLCLSGCNFPGSGPEEEIHFDIEADGLVLVETADEKDGKITRSALASEKRIMDIEELTPDMAEILTVRNGDFNNRITRIEPVDEIGRTVPVTREIWNICHAMKEIKHHVMQIRIFHVRDEWFASAMLNVNLWTPYMFFYYNQETCRLSLLYKFANRDVKAVQVLSVERLKELDQESIGGQAPSFNPKQVLAEQPQLFDDAAKMLFRHADLFREINTHWGEGYRITSSGVYSYHYLTNPHGLKARLNSEEEKILLALTDSFCPYQITYVPRTTNLDDALLFEYAVFNDTLNRQEYRTLICLSGEKTDQTWQYSVQTLQSRFREITPVILPNWFAAEPPGDLYFDGTYEFEVQQDGTALITGYAGTREKITVSQKLYHYPDSYPVSAIGDGAFEDCETVKELILPEGLRSVGKEAFYYCKNLEKVIIPDSVTTIGDGAFASCWSLSDIRLPEGLTSIGYAVFIACHSLTAIHIPDTVTSIGESAFYGCDTLENVNIPAGVTDISWSAFRHCPKINLTFDQNAEGETSPMKQWWEDMQKTEK